MQYSIINYGHYVVYYIPMMYLFYNWKFITFDHLYPFLPSTSPIHPLTALPLATSSLFSVSMSSVLLGFCFLV